MSTAVASRASSTRPLASSAGPLAYRTAVRTHDHGHEGLSWSAFTSPCRTDQALNRATCLATGALNAIFEGVEFRPYAPALDQELGGGSFPLNPQQALATVGLRASSAGPAPAAADALYGVEIELREHFRADLKGGADCGSGLRPMFARAAAPKKIDVIKWSESCPPLALLPIRTPLLLRPRTAVAAQLGPARFPMALVQLTAPCASPAPLQAAEQRVRRTAGDPWCRRRRGAHRASAPRAKESSSCLLPLASCLLPLASCLLPPASCLLCPASCSTELSNSPAVATAVQPPAGGKADAA